MALPPLALIPSATLATLASVLAATTTDAPRPAKAWARCSPIWPCRLAPVTITTLPDKTNRHVSLPKSSPGDVHRRAIVQDDKLLGGPDRLQHLHFDLVLQDPGG